MKTVVSPDMVAHLWAHQSQSEARNQQGNIYFRDSTIYSYGFHFPIARHVTGKNKQPLILLTTRTYSNTTAKHISMVRQSVQHRNVLYCENVQAGSQAEHQHNLKLIRETFNATLLKAATARTNTAQYLQQAENLIGTHRVYRESFGLSLDNPLRIAEDWRAQQQQNIDKQKKEAAKQRTIEAAKEAELRALLQLELNKWKAGESTHWEIRHLPIVLRVKGEAVQTSRGAEIPLSHAVRLWKKVLSIKASGIPYQRNGHTEYAGTFAVDQIQANGTLIAGCHVIEFDAMQELATQQGW
jgi:hypothetical protein